MKRTNTEKLLDRLCTELGFCLPQAEQARLIASHPTSVDAFTDAVFIAENLDPRLADKRVWRQVRERVTEYFDSIEPGGPV